MLKWLALILMLLDHIGYYFYFAIPSEHYWLLRAVGRLAFPIFCYYIVLGYQRTRQLNQYILRLGLFAVGGQILLELTGWLTNLEPIRSVMFTLLAGLLFIFGLDLILHSSRDLTAMMRVVPADLPASMAPTQDYGVRINLKGITLPLWQGLLYGLLLIVGAILIIALVYPDYGWFGLSTIVLFYLMDLRQPDMTMQGHRQTLLEIGRWMISFLLLNLIFALIDIGHGAEVSWSLFESLSVLAIPLFPLHERDKRRYSRVSKYFFYIFYPVHLCVLMLLSTWLRMH